jgi:hypothetical protein
MILHSFVFIRGVNEDFQFVEGQLELVHIKEIQGLMKLFLPTRDPFKQIRPALGKKKCFGLLETGFLI